MIPTASLKTIFYSKVLPLIALSLLAAPLSASLTVPAYAVSESKKNAYYLTVESMPPSLLRTPPAEGGAAAEAQIEAVIAAQQTMPKGDLELIKDEEHMRLEIMTRLVSGDITHDNLPKTWGLLQRVMENTSAIVDSDKKFWHTKRPYMLDKRVKLLVDPLNDSPAYPSGHTTEARVLAEVLGMIYPDHLKMLRTRADDIARHRIEAGVHTQADIEAGKGLALLIVGGLTQSDDFQDDLLLARQENGR